jgi:threonine dehydrogenase-like Zn-dependent dehydrogenase
MKAAILRATNELVLEEIPTPQPGPGQVLVKVKATGICATDHKAVRGKRPVIFPRILGHENAGIIAGTGPGVSHFKEGDEVILSPRGYCGHCTQCRLGNHHYCENTFSTGGDGGARFLPGGFAEYMLTIENCLYRKPSGLSFRAAALTEPLAGAWKGTIQYSNLRIGEDVVVIGTGGIGLLCLMVARRAGAARLVAIDHSEHALANALRLGATHALNPERCRVDAEVRAIMPGGPDLIIEAAGPIEAVNMMLDLRRRGTRFNLFGITTHERFSMDGGETHFMETRMDASFSVTPVAMMNSIRLQERGLVNTEEIITHCFPLDRIVEAMAVMDQTDRNKVVIAQD